MRVDDDDPVEKVQRQAVRRPVIRSPDARLAPVARHDHNRCQLVLERTVDKRKTLNVEHVHLVDKEHARHNLRLAFLLPLGHLGVDLLAHLAPDLARVAGEEGEKALRARVDHVNLVQADGVHDLAPLLQLAVRTLDEFGVGAHGVVVARAGVGAAELGDLAGGLVDGDDIAGHDLFLGHRIDHLGAHVVDCFHVVRLDG